MPFARSIPRRSFLQLSAGAFAHFGLSANDLSRVATPAQLSNGANAQAITSL